MSHSDLRNLHISHEIRASSSLAFKTLHSLVSSYLPIFIAAICSELITVPIIVIPASHLHHPISFFFGILFIFLYSRFLLVIHFIHISVYMSIPISQFITPPPLPRHFPPLVSIRLFSTSVSLFLPCKPVHLCHFSRFHIYALIHNICFSLSD